MSLTRFAIKCAMPAPKIDAFSSYLFVGPHPDDIEIGAGATAARLVQLGKKVSFLICLDGRFGENPAVGLAGDELAARRKEESILSAAKLGVTDVHFLDLCDGDGYTKEELERGIAEVVGRLQPDILFAPDPNSKSESHPDHLNVGCAARKIACFAPYPGIMKGLGAECADVQAIAYYMTARPNRYFATKGLKAQQLDALFSSHLSQYPEGSPDIDSLKLYLGLRSAEYGLKSFHWRGAEAFRVLSKTAMHCLPETGE